MANAGPVEQFSDRNPSLSKNAIAAQSGWLGKAAPDHAQEWLQSQVAPDIVALNVETLDDTATHPYTESLFPIAERLNWQPTRFSHQARPALRGWWVSGIDPATGERMTWGRFKPDASTPVFDRTKNKPAKYLSPSLGSGSSRLILLDVPKQVWQTVAERHQISIESNQQPGFWAWVQTNNIPVVITEGEKKAGCLLSLGYAAISIPGIFSGYRKETGKLIPDLEAFATSGRTVSICFDFETRSATLQNVQLAITKLGHLFEKAGCAVRIITLPGPQKGVDDFVAEQGHSAFHTLYQTASPFGQWQIQQQWQLTYPPAQIIQQPYLSDLHYPETGLICIKSAKGTGKTTALKPYIQTAIQSGRKVLVVTHRIQLGRSICHQLGIPWIEDISIQQQTEAHPGYGLCIDSLHADSQAQFSPHNWRGAVVIFDEVEQVLWHGLNSPTCYEHRVRILETFRELIQVVLATQGTIIAQDADLSNVSIDYLINAAEQPVVPWTTVNHWQHGQGWPVFFYHTTNPAQLLKQIEAVVASGAVFITVDAQKARGRWSSKNLERYFQVQFPEKQLLRIDSETVADPKHPAYRITEQLHLLNNYDIVLVTPTLGTGISIDIRGHFKAVFGIFQGTIPDPEVRQALARVREPVPRYIWAAPFGPGKIGNGSCNYQDVAASTTRLVKYNIQLLKDIDFDIDQQTNPITLRTWAKMAARVNTSLWQFRRHLFNGLQSEGHQITLVESSPDSADLADLLAALTQVQQQQRQQEAAAIAHAPEITPPHYQLLKEQRSKTWQERCMLQKYELQKRYAIAITPELKLKDDQGWFAQLRLHYYLIHNSELVRLRDQQEWQDHLRRGSGKVVLQDLRLLTAQVEALKGLNILNLLQPNRQIRATDADVQHLVETCIRFSRDIKTLFNLTISQRMTPIEVVQALLKKLGLKLICTRRDQTPDGRRGGLRVYQFNRPATTARQFLPAGKPLSCLIQNSQFPILIHPPI